MKTSRISSSVVAAAPILVALACNEPQSDALAPSFAQLDDSRNTIVVNPNANGNGIAQTIQEGIDRVAPGGTVLIKAGTYSEVLLIDKGLTLQSIADGSGPVVITAPGAPVATIEVTAREPVVLRDLTVHKPGVNGILGNGVVDVTLERLTMLAVGSGPGTNRLVRVVNNAAQTGARARLAVRESLLDGGGIGALGVSLQADIDAAIEHNVIRRTTICIFVISFGPAGIAADIVDNDLDQCEGRTAIDVGPTPTQAGSFGTIGVVNIVGNTIRNRDAFCLPTTAIHYQLYTGRIERNSIIGFLQPCAASISDALPSAIWVGSLRGFTPPSPVVRFNDIAGNAHAGLRVAPNVTTSLDARCNYWGSASGPSGVRTGTGDAVLVETGGARPVLAPFATSPVAEGTASCDVEFSLWSAPVRLSDVINTAASEQNPNLSPDGLSLYLVSDRTGGAGALDIWVAHRGSVNDAWGSPVNLGSVINSAGNESAPSLSDDGLLMFFFSDYSGRPGAQGGQDLYVSRRSDAHDDFAWGAPVNLDPYVNTAADEAGSEYGEHLGDETTTLYFNRRPIAVPAAPYDLYRVSVTADGLPSATATPITELNTPAGEFGPEVSTDGREMIFGSGRPGTLGGNDLWVSIRSSVNDPWSQPENLGAPINTALNDRHPSLSVDGRTMFFASTRVGSIGSDDIWMATRTRLR